ncbi:hypothetical protein PWT90_11132 [Aphanocladium album]|nr:hypothetical protein PWT90_11132 [Aphanocladium album]
MESLHIIRASVALGLCILIYQLFSRHNTARRDLPPGPKPLPIVGNIRDFPPTGAVEYRHWLKHKDLYGPISTVGALGKRLILVHDKEMAHNLLVKSSIKSSGRPVTEFMSNLCGYKKLLAFQQYNESFKMSRRLIHQQLGTKAAVAKFHDFLDVAVGRLMVRLLAKPKDMVEHLTTMAGAIMLQLTYGYSVDMGHVDPLVSLVERQGVNLSISGVPLAFPVDLIPILRYIPEWFPGGAFKKLAREFGKVNQAVADVPFQFVQQQMAAGSHVPSFVSNLVQQTTSCDGHAKSNPTEEEVIKWVAAVVYLGGSETTASTLISFILAMIQFPHVQRMAQEELDRVIGAKQLPRIQDRDRLPYIEGVVKEALRWSPVTPLGVPHVMDEDVTLSGYCIPKGAIILPSIWWFLHDPSVYTEPDAFKPERYLPPWNEPDPENEAFGFGRRACPGRNFAESILFLAIAQILAVFNFRKAVDDQGAEVEVEFKEVPGMVCRLADFPYRLEPRSMKHAELIQTMEMQLPEEKSDADSLGAIMMQGE